MQTTIKQLKLLMETWYKLIQIFRNRFK